jgi:hypothetical protein
MHAAYRRCSWLGTAATHLIGKALSGSTELHLVWQLKGITLWNTRLSSICGPPFGQTVLVWQTPD